MGSSDVSMQTSWKKSLVKGKIPFSSQMYYVTLLTYFRGKGPNLRRWLVAQPPSGVLLSDIFRTLLRNKINVYRLRFHLIALIINQLKWHSGQVASRNPYGRWSYCHTSLTIFDCIPWKINHKIIIIICDFRNWNKFNQ